MYFAHAIKRLRKQHGLTQQQLAERLHLSLNGYTNLERGKTQFNEKRLRQIAQVFGMSYQTLLRELVVDNSSYTQMIDLKKIEQLLCQLDTILYTLHSNPQLLEHSEIISQILTLHSLIAKKDP